MPIILRASELTPFLSVYLEDGYKQDAVALREIVVDDDRARAVFDVLEWFGPSDGPYHFTSIHAMILVSQVGIVLACLDNGLAAKPGEIYMRDFSVECRRKIHRTEGLELSARLTRRQPAGDHVLYRIEYEYEEGAFRGDLRCLFPVSSVGTGA